MPDLRRREFVMLLGGAAVAWPGAGRAQERTRRIGVLVNTSEDDPNRQRFLGVFLQALQRLGWEDGRNLRIEIRWAAGDPDRYRRYAAELVEHAPDVVLAVTTPAVVALQQASRDVPIVFVGVVDAVGSGLVVSLARPGGNATGFSIFEYAISAKWLGLLKEIAPRVTRIAVLRDATVSSGIGQFAAIQTVAPIDMELSTINLRDASEIENALAVFARDPDGALIVTAAAFPVNHPEIIAALANRYRLPSVYPFRYNVDAGGLASYGPEMNDPYYQAAGYVDRILRGAKPANLPVQSPTKYELAINLKTARALGLEIPPTLLARANEVIE
jgi:ABC-type uncharacterized transport system substrate-binding protein